MPISSIHVAAVCMTCTLLFSTSASAVHAACWTIAARIMLTQSCRWQPLAAAGSLCSLCKLVYCSISCVPSILVAADLGQGMLPAAAALHGAPQPRRFLCLAPIMQTAARQLLSEHSQDWLLQTSARACFQLLLPYTEHQNPEAPGLTTHQIYPCALRPLAIADFGQGVFPAAAALHGAPQSQSARPSRLQLRDGGTASWWG